MERFVKEYASYLKKEIKSNDLMQEKYKTEKLEKIEKILRMRNRNLISANEAIKTLNEV